MKSANEAIKDALYGAFIDGIVAMREASNSMPNVVARDIGAIHQNTTFPELPTALRDSLNGSVREMLNRLRAEGYVVVHKDAVTLPRNQSTIRNSNHPARERSRRQD